MAQKMSDTKQWTIATVVGVALVAAAWPFAGKFFGIYQGVHNRRVMDNAESLMNDIHDKVARDAEDQYAIAKRNGSAMDAYVQAGMVAAAHLQAKNEAEYRRWKQIESEEAERAGVK